MKQHKEIKLKYNVENKPLYLIKVFEKYYDNIFQDQPKCGHEFLTSSLFAWLLQPLRTKPTADLTAQL